MAGPERRNAYNVLGLMKGATDDQIKHAYVNLVKKYDPEVHTDRFMIVQNAFNRLKDPEQRAREDILTFNPLQGEFSFSEEEKAEVPDEKIEQAIQILDEKMKSDPAQQAALQPKLFQILFIRAHKNLTKKLIKEAMADWQRVLGIDPTHQRAKNNLLCCYCRMGFSYANHRLFDEAIEQWEKAAQMNPDDHQIIHNLALACEFSGKNEKALRYWSETLRRWKASYDRNPADEYLKTCLVEAHRHQGEIGKEETPRAPTAPAGQAAPAASTPSAPTPSAPTAQAPGRPAAAQAGQSPEQQLSAQQEILQLKPDDFDANFRVANLMLELKQWPQAVAHLEEMAKKFPKNIEVLHHLGWAQLNNQQVDIAFRTWNRGIKLDPKNFQVKEALIKAHMMMGRALREKSLYIKSLVHFKALARFMPDSDEVHFELGRTYQIQGDLRSSFMEYQKVLKINPKHKQARSALSELKLRRA